MPTNPLENCFGSCHSLVAQYISIIVAHHCGEFMDLRDIQEVGRALKDKRRRYPPEIVAVPVKFPFKIRRARWKVVETSTGRGLLQQGLQGREGLFGFGNPVDAWQVRNEFLTLKHREEALLKFLNKWGCWCRDTPPTDVEEYWDLQVNLRDFLLWPKAKRRMALKLGFLSGAFTCSLRWEGDDVPYWVVECDGILDALIASVQIDLVRATKFKPCKRKDCLLPFAVKSRHRRLFCSQHCAHLVSVRRGREPQRKRRAGRRLGKGGGGGYVHL
jgi:hypothetical protein